VVNVKIAAAGATTNAPLARQRGFRRKLECGWAARRKLEYSVRLLI
jgi:hypothetical protein